MGAERRKQVLLGGLALVVAVVVYRAWLAGPSTVQSRASNHVGAPARGPAAGKAAGAEAADVHLAALEAERPKPGESARNLFAFKLKPPPPPPPSAMPRLPAAPVVPAGPPPPPPLPPIAFKFIGIVEASAQPAKIAVLSDGHNVFQGREGDIIEGRYRILRIGVESIEMAYLDGRGRQTIRLTGS